MRIIFLIAVLAVLSQPVLAITITPGIQGCITSLSLNASEEIIISGGSEVVVTATIWNVKCGIKHAVLELSGINESWYRVSPKYIASVAPFEQKNFEVEIKIPGETKPGSYAGTYIVKTEEKWFIMHGFSIVVEEENIGGETQEEQTAGPGVATFDEKQIRAETNEKISDNVIRTYLIDVSKVTFFLVAGVIIIVLISQAYRFVGIKKE